MFKIFAIVLLALLFSGKSAAEEPLKQEVNIYGWADYIPESILEDFTKETGIKVNYFGYDDPNLMSARLTVLGGRKYDLIITPSFVISKFKVDNLLKEFDKKKLPNFNNLDPYFVNNAYDSGGKFSLPYLWGTTSLVVNTEKVDLAEMTVWQDLWSPKWQGKVGLMDDEKNVFSIGLKTTGYSINTKSAGEILKAYEKLRELYPNIKVFSNDTEKLLAADEIVIGQVWNGDAAILEKENPKFKYIYPEDGFTIWVDNFAMLSRAKNVDNAYKFLDFMLRPEIAARCTQELGYATANYNGNALLEESMRENKTIFPGADILAKGEYQGNVDAASVLYKLYWVKLKADF